VGHPTGQLPDRLHLLGLLELGLEGRPLRDVDRLEDDAGRSAPIGVTGAGVYLDDDIAPVSTARMNSFAFDGLAGGRAVEDCAQPRFIVGRSDRRRQGTAKDLVAPPAEQLLSCRAPLGQPAVHVERDRRDGRGADEGPQHVGGVAELAFGLGPGRDLAARRIQGIDESLAGPPEEPEGGGGDQTKGKDRQQRLVVVEAVWRNAKFDKANANRRHDAGGDVDDNRGAPAEVWLEETDADDRDEDRERHPDHEQARGQDRLEVKERASQGQEVAPVVAVDDQQTGDDRWDAGGDEPRHERTAMGRCDDLAEHSQEDGQCHTADQQSTDPGVLARHPTGSVHP
jgi:hypothetical protein